MARRGDRMTSSLRLDTTFVTPRVGRGAVRLRLVNAGRETFDGIRLALTSLVVLTPPADSAIRVVRRVGSYHEIAPTDDVVLEPGSVWELGRLDCAYQMVHANDGPTRAFLIAEDGSTTPVHVVPAERAATLKVGDEAPPRVVLDQPTDVTARAWAVAAGCEERLYPDDGMVLAGGGGAVRARIDDSLGAEEFRVGAVDEPASADSEWNVAAGSSIALQWALMALARRLRGDGEPDGTAMTPRYGYRGLMLDVSRHFHPAADVDEVIDVAAWRRLNRVHLHLTDDQAWRLPVASYPALAEVGAWRGHGLPIPPLHGSAADAYGGCYTTDDIRRWVARAAELGIELIPEIDVPGHCYSALAALPELRDPDATGAVESVQHFPHNVLNPGLPATRTFLETVFAEVADLFPGPLIHIGCDEVAHGAWQLSPAAQRYAAARGVDGHRAIERAFVSEIVELVTTVTGRTVIAWQEAAESGGLQPGHGYAIGWTNTEACRRLVAAGHTVVAAPGQAYYLDMATGPAWHLPGMWWGGWITNDTISAFDVTAGWDESERERLVGIQACLWGEHVADRATLRSLLLPRLDAFGDSAWRPLE